MNGTNYLKSRLRKVRSMIHEHEASGNDRQLRMYQTEEAELLSKLGEGPPTWEETLKSERFTDRMLVQAVAMISTEGDNRYKAPETIFARIIQQTLDVRSHERDQIHQPDGS